jgi:DNA-binding response OmpR family regulator
VLLTFWRRPSRTVLIIAEERPDPGLGSAFLEQPDIRLLTSFPDEQGLQLARRERPSLIIDEVRTGNGRGVDFCRRLRTERDTRSIPLIVITSPELCDRVREVGPDAILVKPFVRNDLFDAVSRFVRLPRRRNQRFGVNLRFTFRADGTVGQAFSRDLSGRGAFLKTDREFDLGSRLELRFHLPGSRHEIRCEAIVRSTTHADPASGRQSGIGVEFLDITERDFERVETFVAQHRSPAPLLG